MILRELIAKFGLDFDEKSFKKADGAINDLKSSAQKLVAAIAVFEIGSRLKGMVEGTIDAARSVGGMAAKIGIGTDALQELQFAAEQSGIEVDDFNKSITLMTHKLGAAANGDAGAVKTFTDLGVAIHDSNGQVKTADVLLEDVAEKMKGAKSQAQRLAIAADLFGIRSGTKFAVALKNGAEGVRELRKEARELGGIMSEDMIAQAKETHHVMAKLDFALRGVQNTIVAALLPTIEDVADATLIWFRANREIIKQKIDGYVRKLADGAKTAGRWIYIAGRGIVALTDTVGGFENALRILGVALGVMLVTQIGEAILGLTALNAKMIVTKLAMLADAFFIGVAFLGLVAVIGLVGEEIESLFDDKKQGLFETMQGRWSDLTNQFITKAANSKTVWGLLLGFILAVLSMVADKIDKFFGAFFNQLTLLGSMWDAIVFAIENAPTRLMSAWRNFFKFVDSSTPDWLKSAADFVLTNNQGSLTQVAAKATAGAIVNVYNTVHAPIDASGQSLDEAQVGDIVSRHIDNALTNANAVALQALTPAVSP